MYITYLGHSGFLFELTDCYIIVDYYEGTLPILDKNKTVYVLASHSHQDHYNPQVFEILREQSFPTCNVQAVLSKDIYYKKIPQDIFYLYVKPNQVINLSEEIAVYAFKSTDAGVAFLINTKECTIFHAGDFNDWVWEEATKAENNNMTANFRRELEKIADFPIHVACFPLDPHLGKNYARGLSYFLSKIKPDIVFPMHYWKQDDIIKKFLEEYPAYVSIVCDTEHTQHKFYKNST